LGLRAGDIAQLRLDDVDWKEAGICVSGKGRRQTLMPLTQEIGDAIASYIKDGRPQTVTSMDDGSVEWTQDGANSGLGKAMTYLLRIGVH
jgi:integrase